MADSKAPTHTAFALKREGRKYGRWLEIGSGRQESNGVFHGILDRLPVGGFSGYVYFAPVGTEPPPPEPERPARTDANEEDSG